MSKQCQCGGGEVEAQRGPHGPHPIFIFQTIFISNLITMIKKGT